MSTEKRPNIVVLFTDDQRFDTIAALGNPNIITPNMDRLVKKGTSFTQAHIPGGTHGAVCMPSRAMLFTGRSLFRIKDAGESIAEDQTTLGEKLQSSGYDSFGSGKWHNGKKSFNRNHNRGSHIFFGGMADHWNVPMYDYDSTGKYQGNGRYITNPFKTNKTKTHKYDYCYKGRHSSEIIAQAGIDYLKERDESNPFFMYLSFLAPHDPRTMPDNFKKMYDPNTIELPKNFLKKYPFNNGGLGNRDEKLASYPRKPDEVKEHIAEYYGMISHLDYEIGRVLDELQNQNLLESTIIVLAGDNGLALGQHGLMGKQSCHEHSVRVPLIFSGPGIPENVQLDSMVYLYDIYPTLCDYSGLSTPETVDGKSLMPLIYGKKESVRDDLYLVYSRYQRGVKTKQYKLIEYVLRGKHLKTQLFDLQNDPLEIKNLASNPEYRDVIKTLRDKMVKNRDEWDETKTHWGKFWWEAFSRSNRSYKPSDVKSFRFQKYKQAWDYNLMVLKSEQY
ncbi:MAG: sulfatase-like hydrolase/transferase [Spirochaetaceae bacterium]